MMSPCNCGEHAEKLLQQISVMRRELKNLRQRADSAIRSHRKQMTTLQSALTSIGENKHVCVEPNFGQNVGSSLERGHIRTTPIGYINSCFAVKNGTPRQPTVCDPSRATLQIEQTVFNNPDHPLIGLEEYSHVWIIFLFHKNGHLAYKAKVKPPRLNGQKVGVYSTRSPHRPNALGLTLAKLEKVEGDTLHLMGVDMISGTPVLDIKPYIPCYDCPHTRLDTAVKEFDLLSDDESDCHITSPSATNTAVLLDSEMASKTASKTLCQVSPRSDGLDALGQMLSEVEDYVQQGELYKGWPSEDGAAESNHSGLVEHKGEAAGRPHVGQESYSTIAAWIKQPPVSTLEVRFTSHAERELMEFVPSDSTVMDKPRFKFLKDFDEAVAAIKAVLSADPRSVYRRTHCQDRLFFFSIDTADVTCWFGDGFAEVLRVQPLKL